MLCVVAIFGFVIVILGLGHNVWIFGSANARVQEKTSLELTIPQK